MPSHKVYVVHVKIFFNTLKWFNGGFCSDINTIRMHQKIGDKNCLFVLIDFNRNIFDYFKIIKRKIECRLFSLKLSDIFQS